MAYRRRLKNKKAPEGWELIEEVVDDFEQQMKDAVSEEHEGKRRNELTWKIHRIHWEKNRFIFDLMYKRKVMSRELVRTCPPTLPPSSFFSPPSLPFPLPPPSPWLSLLLCAFAVLLPMCSLQTCSGVKPPPFPRSSIALPLPFHRQPHALLPLS